MVRTAMASLCLLGVVGESITVPCSLVGVSFSPAGLLTPFHLGASARLKEAGVIRETTSLTGTSGGAIVAAVTALGLAPEDSLAACNRIAQKCRDLGTYRTLSTSLRTEVDDMVSDDSWRILNGRAGRTVIGYQQIWPQMKGVFVSRFSSKEDVCSVIMASCSIPFYFSGNLASPVRDGLGLDGYFSCPSRFGCPETMASSLELLVTPFDPAVVLSNFSASTPTTKKVDIISPKMLPPGKWSLSSAQLVRLALAPPVGPGATAASDAFIRAQYDMLFEAGSDSADAWCRRVPEGASLTNAETVVLEARMNK